MTKRTVIVGYGVLLSTAVWAATQWTGYRLGYQPSLGGGVPIAGHVLYPPWDVFVWMARFGDRIPRALNEAYAILAAGFASATLLAAVARPRRFAVRAIGRDRWGTKRDLHAAGLLTGRGTVVGAWGSRVLTYDGPEHQIVSGASRSGKGVGHVVPTLLNWPASALVYDVKCELWPLTAGYRETLGSALFFNPASPESARFNPLFEIRKGPEEIRDTQNVVEMLVNPDGSKTHKDIWDAKAAEFLVAVILHVLYAAPDDQKNLATVRAKLLDYNKTCARMIATPHRLNPQTGRPEVHPEVARVARDLITKYEKFRDSVAVTASSYLTLWADELVARNTATSDFRLSDLMCADKPLTLYLQPPPSDAARLRPLIRLIINQVCRALMEHLEADSDGQVKQHRLLLLLDEFPTLGRLDYFSMNLRQMGGYGLKAHLIVQSFNDIVEAYGPNNTILDNCHILTAFASADTATCQRISQMSGTTTEYRESYSEPRPRWGMGRRSVSYAEQVRPLLQPGDVRELSNDQQLLFVTGHKPLRTDKLRYYAHPLFRKRLLAPPSLADMLTRVSAPAVGWLGERPKGPRLRDPDPLRSNVPPGLRKDLPLFPPESDAAIPMSMPDAGAADLASPPPDAPDEPLSVESEYEP
jgi:type IV secretion system protein VirD4